MSGMELRAARKAAGLNQQQLAVRAEVGVSTVSRLENGHRCDNLRTLRRLARALGVPLSRLLDEAELDAGSAS